MGGTNPPGYIKARYTSILLLKPLFLRAAVAAKSRGMSTRAWIEETIAQRLDTENQDAIADLKALFGGVLRQQG